MGVKPTPFDRIPKAAVFKRAMALFSPLLLVGIAVVGVYATDPLFVEDPDFIGYDAKVILLGQDGLFRRARAFYSLVLADTNHPPSGCGEEGTQSEFRAGQCEQFWTRVGMRWLLAGLPLFLVLGFAGGSVGYLNFVYRKAQKRIRKDKPKHLGTLTDPALMPQTTYHWFFELQPLSVQVSDGSQVIAFIPKIAPVPRAGEQVALYELGGRKLALTLHAPHMVAFG